MAVASAATVTIPTKLSMTIDSPSMSPTQPLPPKPIEMLFDATKYRQISPTSDDMVPPPLPPKPSDSSRDFAENLHEFPENCHEFAAIGGSLTKTGPMPTTTTASANIVEQMVSPSSHNYLAPTPTVSANRSPLATSTNTTTFDYLYEFSETRKVLEDFFKCPNAEDDKKIADCFNESDTGSFVSHFVQSKRQPVNAQSPILSQDNLNEIDDSKKSENNYIGQRLAKLPSSGRSKDFSSTYHSPRATRYTENNYMNHQQVSV